MSGVQMENLFERAMVRGELLEFAHGRGDYFVPDPDWGTHLVIRSYQPLVPLLADPTKQEVVAVALADMFDQLLKDTSQPGEDKPELLLQHLYAYYHFRTERRGIERDIPPDTQARLITLLRPVFERNRADEGDPYGPTFRNILRLGGLKGLEL